jgi:hypothetical protein
MKVGRGCWLIVNDSLLLNVNVSTTKELRSKVLISFWLIMIITLRLVIIEREMGVLVMILVILLD